MEKPIQKMLFETSLEGEAICYYSYYWVMGKLEVMSFFIGKLVSS